MSSIRGSLLGNYPPAKSPALSNMDGMQNSQSRRTLLPNGPPGAATTSAAQPSRRTILSDPTSVLPTTSPALINSNSHTDSWLTSVPMLDRMVSFLDRTDAEKRSPMPASGSNNNRFMPLLATPATEFDCGILSHKTVPLSSTQRRGGEHSYYIQRGSFSRPSTTSPHSSRSTTPVGSVSNQSNSFGKRRSTFLHHRSISPPRSVGTNHLGLLDRHRSISPQQSRRPKLRGLLDRHSISPQALVQRRRSGMSDRRSMTPKASSEPNQVNRSKSVERSAPQSANTPEKPAVDQSSIPINNDLTPLTKAALAEVFGSPFIESRRNRSRTRSPISAGLDTRRSCSPDRTQRQNLRNSVLIKPGRWDPTSDGGDHDCSARSMLDRTAEEKKAQNILDRNSEEKKAQSILDRTAEEKQAKNILDRTAEEKRADVQLQAHTRNEGSIKVNHHQIGSSRTRPRRRIIERRLVPLVAKLTPLELKLALSPAFCKFIANSPRVYVKGLSREVVESAQYGYGTKAKNKTPVENKPLKTETEKPKVEKKFCQVKPMPTTVKEKEETMKSRPVKPAPSTVKHNEIAPSPSAATAAAAGSAVQQTPLIVKQVEPKPQTAKRRTKLIRQDVEPEVLNIPGIPTMNSLLNFKIKKKTLLGEKDGPKKEGVNGGTWKKLPPTSSVNLLDEITDAMSETRKRPLHERMSKDEYVSPLERADNSQMAKKRRDEEAAKNRLMKGGGNRTARQESNYGSTSKESSSRTTPLLLAPPLLPEPLVSNWISQHVPAVSPSLSTSSQSSFRTEATGFGNISPPPFTGQPRSRRTLLGDAPSSSHQPPLLPTPVIGPRTPPHPPPDEPLVASFPSRRNEPLLGEQPLAIPNWEIQTSPVLPNWEVGPPRNGPYQRQVPYPYYEDNSTALVNVLTPPEPEPPPSDFDPDIFLNRLSDYSSDGSNHAAAPETTTTSQVINDVQPAIIQPTTNNSDQFLHTENAAMENRWPPAETFHQPEETATNHLQATPSSVPVNPGGTIDLNAEQEMKETADYLLEQLNKDGTGAGGALSNEGIVSEPIASTSSNLAVQPVDFEDVAQLRNNIRMLLSDQASILQSDNERRRRAMELLPALDDLEALARSSPGIVTWNHLEPIMHFIQETLELSSSQSSFGISAAAAENETGIISHTSTTVERTTPRNHFTPM